MIEQTKDALRVVSPMTITAARALLQAGDTILASCNGPVKLDLSAVTEADSAALAVLLGWQRSLGARGTLRIQGAPESIRSMADMYGLTEVLTLD